MSSVHIEEQSAVEQPIEGAPTSVAAFVGAAERGQDHVPTRIRSFTEYERMFGGHTLDDSLSYAVSQFFENGGKDAIVVRVPALGARRARVRLKDAKGKSSVDLTAAGSGSAYARLHVDIDRDRVFSEGYFHLTLTDLGTGAVSRYENLHMDPDSAEFAETVLSGERGVAHLLHVKVIPGAGRPADSGAVGGKVLLTKISKGKRYTIALSSTYPKGKIQSIAVDWKPAGEGPPKSVAELAARLEERANQALALTKTGAAIRVRAAGAGDRLGARLEFPGASVQVRCAGAKAVLTFADAGVHPSASILGLDMAIARPSHFRLSGGSNGKGYPRTAEWIGDVNLSTGLGALENQDFNLLCIPDAVRGDRSNPGVPAIGIDAAAVYGAAKALCEKRGAILLADFPVNIDAPGSAKAWIDANPALRGANVALYFPRLLAPDPLRPGSSKAFPPSGAIAGLYARTDMTRGVWKAPAGADAKCPGFTDVARLVNDSENGILTNAGVNSIRRFPEPGIVAWGARTTVAPGDGPWKYIPVRRLAIHVEQSLTRGLSWVVFELNQEPTWARVRSAASNFLDGLFRAGALPGNQAKHAYFVKCDATTCRDAELSCIVGLAVVKPAEFLILTLRFPLGA